MRVENNAFGKGLWWHDFVLGMDQHRQGDAIQKSAFNLCYSASFSATINSCNQASAELGVRHVT
jgi:hypothetical protein